MRALRTVVIALATVLPAAAQINIQLSAESARAFDEYVKTAESQMDWRGRFQPGNKPGELRLAAGGPQSTIEIKDALIHDWAAALFVPNATPQKALAVLQSYDDYKDIYAPQVSASQVLNRKGNHYLVHLRLNKSKGLVVVILDTDYDVDFRALDHGRWSEVSRSTEIHEVQFGKPQPDGTGLGFLWRLNAYWIVEPRPDGVYLECRSISMSRDIPPGLGWMIKPMVTSLPKESLRDTMLATARAMMK